MRILGPESQEDTLLMNKKDTDQKDVKKTKEELDVLDSFSKLSLESHHCFHTSDHQEGDRTPPDSASVFSETFDTDHSDSSSDESESDSDDDLVPKCPDKSTKITQQTRKQNAPYRRSVNPYREGNWTHHCGGTVTTNAFFNNNYDNQTPPATPVETSFQTPFYGNDVDEGLSIDKIANIVHEELFIDNIEDIRKIAENNLSEEQYELLQNLAEKAHSDKSDEGESDQKGTDSSTELLYQDSAYDSCSPNSMMSNSPMPQNTQSDVEASPLHEIESCVSSYSHRSGSYLFDSHLGFKAPHSPRLGERNDRTLPLNIPVTTPETPYVDRSQYSRSLPTAQNQWWINRPNIAPEPAIFHEHEMTQLTEDRIKRKINRKILDVEWARVLLDKEFKSINDNHETKLMAHLRQARNTPRYFEVLHSILDKIKKFNLTELLEHSNCRDENALLIAIFECTDTPIIARYIVDVMSYLGIDVDKADSQGNSLIHRLVAKGDRFVQVLAELLNAKMVNGSPCFCVDKRNVASRTPLHIATACHSTELSTLAITKLLVKHNSDVSLMDLEGKTPIHTAIENSCNPQLIKSLLASNYIRKAISVVDHIGNSALHFACMRNNLQINHQAEVIKQLVKSHWNSKLLNIYGNDPLSLTNEERRKIIKEFVRK